MSYEVDLNTQLFCCLGSSEACELEKVIENLVLKGVPCMGHPAFRAWAKALRYDDQQLLVHTTAFPQRALLSLLRRGKFLKIVD